ncbi:MAG: amino acid transporter [Gammaproteobacteria bacterium]|nr:amino acid transporter [Gammaproteobacteria bacterium]
MAQTPEVTHWDGPPLEAWRPWRPQEATAVLAGLDVTWCVVGGWAIDLFLGRETRSHGDLEIAIARADFPRLRDHLRAYRLHSVGNGEVRAMSAGEVTPPDKHQNWVLDVDEDVWRMDVMLEPGDEATWVYRRDESVRAPRQRMVSTRDGVSFLKPEAVLLYKAKATRPKDEADFAACLPLLDGEARHWLRTILTRLHPEHSWLSAL